MLEHCTGNDKFSVKVIYLVRDPRAVMNSRYRMAWCQHTANCTNSEVLCQRMRANIEILKEITNSSLGLNVALIRHEDLVMDMFNSTEKLLQFLQMKSLDKQLVSWIQAHTSVDDFLENPHSTYRNIKELPTQWRMDLAREEFVEIEENCKDVMRELGYRLVGANWSNQTKPRQNKSIKVGDDELDLISIASEYPLKAVSVYRVS